MAASYREGRPWAPAPGWPTQGWPRAYPQTSAASVGDVEAPAAVARLLDLVDDRDGEVGAGDLRLPVGVGEQHVVAEPVGAGDRRVHPCPEGRGGAGVEPGEAPWGLRPGLPCGHPAVHLG